MEGALFDGIKLSECSWDSPTYATTPVCTIAWIPDSSPDHYRLDYTRLWNSIYIKADLIEFMQNILSLFLISFFRTFLTQGSVLYMAFF